MFNRCDFLMGDNDSIVIAVPAQVPKSEPLTILLHKDRMQFVIGNDEIADIACSDKAVINRLANRDKVGLIEFIEGQSAGPVYISAIANIEVNRCSFAA